jgi:hypothetical protein
MNIKYFTDMAQQAFSFLENVGFRLTQSGPTRLQYESAQTFVTIEWDARSGELNVFIGLQPKEDRVSDAFSLTARVGWDEAKRIPATSSG